MSYIGSRRTSFLDFGSVPLLDDVCDAGRVDYAPGVAVPVRVALPTIVISRASVAAMPAVGSRSAASRAHGPARSRRPGRTLDEGLALPGFFQAAEAPTFKPRFRCRLQNPGPSLVLGSSASPETGRSVRRDDDPVNPRTAAILSSQAHAPGSRIIATIVRLSIGGGPVVSAPSAPYVRCPWLRFRPADIGELDPPRLLHRVHHLR